MSIKSDLKKEGIEVINQLDTLTVNSLAKNISKKLCNTFPNYGLNENELFIKLSRLNMFIAKMPEGMAEANYFYKNTSIYFNEHIPMEDIEEFAIHECIHFIQEIKDKKNYLIRMGLCDCTEFKIYGLALNEASVQLMSSKVNGIPKENVKYFGISFNTNSPSYYPLECCLVSQLAYLVGEDILFKSTLQSDDTFKYEFAKLTSRKTFITIENSIDEILFAEEDIIKLNNKIAKISNKNKKIDDMLNKISELKNKIREIFIKTQNLIISSYFDSAFLRIENLEQLENYRKKLYNFKDFIGSCDNYTFFNNYYVEKMAMLEHKYNILENGGIETAIFNKDSNEKKIYSLFNKIRRILFGKNSQEEEN